MQKIKLNNQGLGLIVILTVVVVVALVGFSGWYVWHKNHKAEASTSSADSKDSTDTSKNSDTPTTKDVAASWTSVTTQGGAFTMRVPDGWQMVKYPGDFIGSGKVTYSKGEPAKITSSDTEYAGDGLLFRASIYDSNSTALSPQWQSPQSGLTESEEDFAIGSLQGKRFKAVFTGSSDQIVYEYEFNITNNKRLTILYTIYPSEGGVDDVATVEKAIKTITF